MDRRSSSNTDGLRRYVTKPRIIPARMRGLDAALTCRTLRISTAVLSLDSLTAFGGRGSRGRIALSPQLAHSDVVEVTFRPS